MVQYKSLPRVARYEIIRIDYPGDCISVNHYLGKRKDGGYYVKPEAEDWMEELGWLVKRLHLEDWALPLEITCSGTFKDMRSCPDLSNLSKCTLDAIEEASGINDKNFRWHDGKPYISDKEKPYLLITITETLPKPHGNAVESNSDRVIASGSGKLRGRKRKGLKMGGVNED